MKKPLKMLATTTLGAMALATAGYAASARVGVDQESYRLVQVNGAPLPVVVEVEDDGCHEEVLAATLTLHPDGEWLLVTRERETCGAAIEEEESREDGRYRIEGDRIRFLDDDDDDDHDEDDHAEDGDETELDLDDLAWATRSADGLTVRLEDGQTTLRFQR